MYVDEGENAADSGYESCEISVAVAGVYGSLLYVEKLTVPNLRGGGEREELYQDEKSAIGEATVVHCTTYPRGEKEAWSGRDLSPLLSEDGRIRRTVRLNQATEVPYSISVSCPNTKKTKNM